MVSRSVRGGYRALPTRRRAESTSLILKRQLGQVYACAGQYDDAVAQLQKVIELDAEYGPAYAWLGDTFLRMSMHEEAIAELEKATELSGTRYTDNLGYAYARAGRTAEAQVVSSARDLKTLVDAELSSIDVRAPSASCTC